MKRLGTPYRHSDDPDDDGYWIETDSAKSITVWREAGREPEDTGLLNASGERIMKVYADAHPIGFLAEIEDHEPEIDFFYAVAAT